MVKIAIPNFCINFLNKTAKSLSILCDFAVAPLTGAWIKMNTFSWTSDRTMRSHPSRVRGLKWTHLTSGLDKKKSRTLYGAWIKTI